MPAELALRLLGEPQLTLDGNAIAGLTSPRIYVLLAYLIIHRNIPISRQQLSFVLWPDSSEKQARTNLRQLLLKLRLALPNLDKIIVDDGKWVQWRQDADCQVDVVTFQVALTDGRFDIAVELHCGELLAGYTDEWVDSVRTQIESQFTNALRTCIEVHEGQRDYLAAIRYAELWIQQDHLNEPAYCRLMSLYAQAGDLGSVKRIYQQCLDTLVQALNIEPSSETQALFRQLSSGESTAPFTNQKLVNTLLVGREAEWQKLIQTWRHCEVGTARLLAISGEAGIGKTRLAEEFVSWVGQLGITVISACSYLGEDAVPYTPVIACLRSPQLSDRLLKLEDIWLRELARLVPELYTVRPNLSAPGPLKESWQRHRFFEAITRAIVAPEQPLVLWMEDAQWMDPESIAWLRFCLHFVPRAKLLVLCTVRSDELAEDHPFTALQLALRQEGQSDELQLGRLNATETAQLASHIGFREIGKDEQVAIFRETEGHPLFIVEMIRANATSLPTAPNDSVQAMIDRRLRQLSLQSQETIAIAATIGRDFSFDILAKVSTLDEMALIASLEELMKRHVIRERTVASSEVVYDFTHERIREFAYTKLSAGRRKVLHRLIADAILQTKRHLLDDNNAQLAMHYERASIFDCALRHYRQAIEHAHRMGATANVLQLCRSAVTLLKTIDPSVPDQQHNGQTVLEYLGEALSLKGQHTEAIAGYKQAIQIQSGIDPITDARLQRKVGEAFTIGKAFSEAEAAYLQALDILGPQTHFDDDRWRHEWLELQRARASLNYWLNRPEQIQSLSVQLQPIVEAYGSVDEQATFYQSLLMSSLRRERYRVSAEILDHVTKFLSVLHQMPNSPLFAFGVFGCGFTYLWHNDLEIATKLFDEALVAATRIGDMPTQSRILNYQMVISRMQGDVAALQEQLPKSIRVAEEANLPEYVLQAECNKVWIVWKRKRYQEAKALATTIIQQYQGMVSGHASLAFMWQVYLPALDITVRQKDFHAAIDLARDLSSPQQMCLANGIDEMLVDAVKQSTAKDTHLAIDTLQRVLQLAAKSGYL